MDQELLQVLKSLEESIISQTKRLILESSESLRQEMEKNRVQNTKDVVTLMDTQFMTQFNLLAERLDLVMERMPSQEDMDIIDGTLQEHESELKILRQEVKSLKKAQ